MQEYMHPNAIMRHASKAIDGVLGWSTAGLGQSTMLSKAPLRVANSCASHWSLARLPRGTLLDLVCRRRMARLVAASPGTSL